MKNIKKKIAIIGSGIAGLSSAWLLSKKFDVTIFEANNYPGGHANTVSIPVNDELIDVDVGFIVHNNINYPNFVKLLKHFHIPTKKSSMSFSVSINNGQYEYASFLPFGPFVQISNLYRERFIRMLIEIPKFYKFANNFDFKRCNNKLTVENFLNVGGFSRYYTYDHLLPMASAIWSQPISKILDFDAETFIEFYKNHGLLRFRDRPKWKTIDGGSKTYINKVLSDFDGKLYLSSPVSRVSREDGIIKLECLENKFSFDHVVFAIQPKNIIKILDSTTDIETKILDIFKSEDNDCYLHSDVSLMPKRKRSWSSWNYISNDKMDYKNKKVFVSYWLNKLQNINVRKNLFLSLNPPCKPEAGKIYCKFNYLHPIFNTNTIQAQKQIQSIQGLNNTWYCGAWKGFGFHEDGLNSGIYVAEKLGCKVPWV